MFCPRCVVIVSLGRLFIKLFIQEFHLLCDFDSTFVFDIYNSIFSDTACDNNNTVDSEIFV